MQYRVIANEIADVAENCKFETPVDEKQRHTRDDILCRVPFHRFHGEQNVVGALRDGQSFDSHVKIRISIARQARESPEIGVQNASR